MVAKSSSSSAWINVAVIGPHQHGKSTLAGFLLYALQQLPTTFMDEADQAVNNRKDPTRKFAFLLDRKAHERMFIANVCRGTQVISRWVMERRGRHYLLINSPGWNDRITSLIGALSEADAVLLVVDTGAYFENLKSMEAQGDKVQKSDETISRIYTHLSLAHFYGIQQLIIALHKMDKIDFSERSYLEVKTHLEHVSEKLGWDKSQVHFLPTAVIATEEKGFNVTESASAFSTWSHHPSLLRAIEQLHPQPLPTSPHFRMQLNSIKQGKQVHIPGFQLVVTGRIAAGNVHLGDELLFQPSGIRCKVERIHPIDNSRSSGNARPRLLPTRGDTGETVSLLCTILEGETRVNRGEIAGTPTSSPRVSQKLRAELTLLATPPFSDLFKKNLTGTFVSGYFITRFRIDGLSFDRGITWIRNGLRPNLHDRTVIEKNLSDFQKESTVLAELSLVEQTPLETHIENSHLSRFVLLDFHLSPLFGGHVIEVL